MKTVYILFCYSLYMAGVCLCSAAHASESPPDSIPKKSSTLFFPVIGRAPETSWILGAASITVFKTKSSDSLLRTSTIPFGIIYSLKHQIILSSGINIYFPGEKYIFRLENTYTKFPDRFWGIGYDTPYSNLEYYSYSQLFINPQFLKKIYNDYFAGVCLEYANVYSLRHDAGGLFDTEQITGKNGSRSIGIGLELSRDTRKNTFSPSDGSLIKVLLLSFNKAVASEYNYLYTEIDLRRYIALNKKNLLACQFITTLTSGDVPFRSLSSIGGPSIMRGFYGGRYRDKNMFAFQLEERLHLWWRFGLVVFGGLGQVSSDYLHWHLKQIKYSIGAGLRFAILPKEKLNIRFDYGIGNQSGNFYLTVTEAF